MLSTRTTRIAAFVSATTLLATMTLTSAASAQSCDYTFPSEGGELDVLKPGEVACGGPGSDAIGVMQGGLFLGRGGADTVVIQRGGTFRGGVGADTVHVLGDGTFEGGVGPDGVEWLLGGAFKGQVGADLGYGVVGGRFYGGRGDDGAYGVASIPAEALEGLIFDDLPRVAAIDSPLDGLIKDYPGGTFVAGVGNDRAFVVTGDGLVIGGEGNERVEVVADGGTLKAGPGFDKVRLVEGGTVFGGAQGDSVELLVSGGRFIAGAGADTVADIGEGSRFVGARGQDAVTGGIRTGSTFHGGGAPDSAVVCDDTNTITSVEQQVAADCPPLGAPTISAASSVWDR